ncbi:hypothetical protein EVAR_38968_1 [Eumeta japonica]|uniref:Uncharacterized protein n=1 Tax=Eumeta variegata TaxID=151549 RepID=A0A4C1WB40_EUMVA|nr:hypothetical protein EVAR_38968_1 [Eumeta japonica]
MNFPKKVPRNTNKSFAFPTPLFEESFVGFTELRKDQIRRQKHSPEGGVKLIFHEKHLEGYMASEITFGETKQNVYFMGNTLRYPQCEIKIFNK